MAPTSAAKSTTTALTAKPFAVVVDAEIKPERMEEFLELIEKNAVGSRAEPGCLRFGTLRYILLSLGIYIYIYMNIAGEIVAFE